MVHHDFVLQPGDILTIRVGEGDDRSTTAPRNNSNNNRNWEGGKRKNTTRKVKVSGYMKFCKVMRPEILKENPGITFKDVGKRLGEKWRSLSATEKSSY